MSFRFLPIDYRQTDTLSRIGLLGLRLVLRYLDVHRMIKDDREKAKPERSLFAEKDLTDKIDRRR